MTTISFSLGGDLPVHRLGFGAMRLAVGPADGEPRGRESGIAVLRRAVELGVNHIDTAGFYGRGQVLANEQIRAALAPYRSDLVIATKVGPLFGPDLPRGSQAAPEQLRGLVELELRALGLDRLDLVYLRVGGVTGPGGESIAERYQALAELREEGLIRHLGVSNVDAAQLAEARAVAPVVAVQNLHSAGGSDHGAGAGADNDAILAECERAGIAFVPFFPLGGGQSPIATERLAKVAARLGATAAQISLAALLASSPVTLAIPGTGSIQHLEENSAAAELVLAPEDLAELTQA